LFAEEIDMFENGEYSSILSVIHVNMLKEHKPMIRLKGVLFDYGHTLVWFPRYKKTHLSATRNVQRILQVLRVPIEASKIRMAVDDFAHGTDGVVVNMDEEFKEILHILGVESYSSHDLRSVIQAYWRPYIQDACLRKGVKEMLQHLKMLRLKLGIVANIWSGGMSPVLKRLDIQGFFDTIVASSDVGFKKPDPRIFSLVLNHLRLRAEQVIMVGDNPGTDILASHNYGMKTARLMRGPNRIKPDLVTPDFKIKNLPTLTSIVQLSP
jgi:HAD superfamily hydrolase (TIGR01549 family)